MKILYIDTTTSYLYTGLVVDGKLIADIKEDFGKDLSSCALQKISELLNNNNIEPNDIDKIMVVNGPGSFTGIRVGLTIAKTYAWSLNKKISTISSLEAMAISSKSEYDYFIPVIDARRGYVYGGIYDKDGNSILKDQYVNLETLKITVDNLPGKYVFITNDKINDLNSVENYTPDFIAIVNKYQDKDALNPHEIDALYLKLTEAEEKQNA